MAEFISLFIPKGINPICYTDTVLREIKFIFFNEQVYELKGWRLCSAGYVYILLF